MVETAEAVTAGEAGAETAEAVTAGEAGAETAEAVTAGEAAHSSRSERLCSNALPTCFLTSV